MKKKLAVVLAVVMMLAMGAMLIACDPSATKLATPVISINGSTISWNAVDNADKYVVYKGEAELATVTETFYVINESVPGTYEYKVMAKSEDKRYTDSDLSEKVTYEVKAKSPDAIQLAKPAIELNGAVISWDAVANADKYVVYKNGNEIITVKETEYTIQETAVGTYKFTVRAKSDSENYTDSDLSDEVEYKVSSVEGTSVTLSRLLTSIDLVKGLKLEGDLDFKVLAALMGSETTDPTGYVDLTGKILAAMLIDNGEFDLDFKLDAQRSLGDEAKMRAFIRGNSIYSAEVSLDVGEGPIDEDDIIYNFSNNSDSDSNISTNNVLVGILSNISKLGDTPLVRYLESKIEFTKNGTGFETQIDVVDILTTLVTKIENVLNDISDTTTLSELYNAIGGKEILDALFGDTSLQEIYTKIRSMLPPYEEVPIPEQLDGEKGFIAYIQQVFELKGMEGELPEAKDLSASGYMDEVLKEFGDRSLKLFAEFILNFMNPAGPGDPAQGYGVNQNTAATDGDAQTSVVEQLKQTIMGFITPIKEIISLNTLKFTIGSDAEGNLSSISVEAKIEQSIMSLFAGASLADNGDNGETDPVYIIDGTASIKVTHGNVTLTSVNDLNTLDDVMSSHVGEKYTCSSVEVKIDGQTINADQFEEHDLDIATGIEFEIKKDGNNYEFVWEDGESGELSEDIGVSGGMLYTWLFYGGGHITFEDNGSITISGKTRRQFGSDAQEEGKVEILEFVMKLQKADA